MSTRSIPSRRPERRRVPFPRLPRSLVTHEVAWRKRFGRPWFAGPSPTDAPPLLPEDLTATARTRLRQRAEIRYRRIRGRGFRDNEDWFWIKAELALCLPRASKATVRRWRQVLYWAVYHAELRS